MGSPEEKVTVMRIGDKKVIDAAKPPLWRRKDRAQFERAQPSGFENPASKLLLVVLRQETVKSERLPPMAR